MDHTKHLSHFTVECTCDLGWLIFNVNSPQIRITRVAPTWRIVMIYLNWCRKTNPWGGWHRPVAVQMARGMAKGRSLMVCLFGLSSILIYLNGCCQWWFLRWYQSQYHQASVFHQWPALLQELSWSGAVSWDCRDIWHEDWATLSLSSSPLRDNHSKNNPSTGTPTLRTKQLWGPQPLNGEITGVTSLTCSSKQCSSMLSVSVPAFAPPSPATMMNYNL